MTPNNNFHIRCLSFIHHTTVSKRITAIPVLNSRISVLVSW